MGCKVFEKASRGLFVWFCKGFSTCAAKNHLMSVFMEGGMVCGKGKLAGIAGAGI